MTERPSPTDQPPHYWSQSATAARWRDQNGSPVRRFIGGSPLGVLAKLLVISFLVGALLMWLHITPSDVFQEVVDLLNQLGLFGFRSVRDVGNYLVAGAVVVIPIWLVIRLLSFRGR